MDSRIKRIYIGLHDNHVIAVDTSLPSFVSKMKSVEPATKSLSFHEKQFKTKEVIYYSSDKGKQYKLQKIETPKE